MTYPRVSKKMADFEESWRRFFDALRTFLRQLEHTREHPNREYCEYAVDRLELWNSTISGLIAHLNGLSASQFLMRCVSDLDDLLQNMWIIRQEWEDLLTNVNGERRDHFSYAAPSICGETGRPKFHISKEQLQYLRSMNFKWVEIAKLLGVSYSTVYRRRLELVLLHDPIGEAIDDVTVNALVSEIRRRQPALGQTMVWGQLRSEGYHVTRAQVRDAIRSTDPINTTLRWHGITPRRPYSVPSPNSLWHADGQHKLIRWRMVVHAAIDGFSRTVLFIKCSTNNRADTVYRLFLKAVSQYGLPSRLRVDQGGENTLIARHMLRYRGTGRRSVLVGSSVHNQRIERLWRDSHRCVTSLYHGLFHFLEENDLLDPLDEEHLFALHYTFVPKVNTSLEVFRGAWNNHGVRTAGGKSPLQLFTAGMLRLRHSGLIALDFFDNVDNEYGSEGDFSLVHEDTEGVSIPASTIDPTDEQLAELRESVDPHTTCDDYGIAQYCQALDIIQSWSRSP